MSRRDGIFHVTCGMVPLTGLSMVGVDAFNAMSVEDNAAYAEASMK
jgi:hypothetical protein